MLTLFEYRKKRKNRFVATGIFRRKKKSPAVRNEAVTGGTGNAEGRNMVSPSVLSLQSSEYACFSETARHIRPDAGNKSIATGSFGIGQRFHAVHVTAGHLFIAGAGTRR